MPLSRTYCLSPLNSPSLTLCIRHTHTCIHAHADMYTHTHVHTHTYTHIHTNKNTHTHTQTHTHAHTCTHTHILTHTHTYTLSLCLSLVFSRSLTPSPPYTLAHSHSPSHTHTRSHIHTHTHIGAFYFSSSKWSSNWLHMETPAGILLWRWVKRALYIHEKPNISQKSPNYTCNISTYELWRPLAMYPRNDPISRRKALFYINHWCIYIYHWSQRALYLAKKS